jgi:hypothetical protein
MKIIYTLSFLLFAAAAAAQPDSAPRMVNSSVRRFKEQMHLSAEQSAQLDSMLSQYILSKKPADTTPSTCMRIKDAEIRSILTEAQRKEYDILKQEWTARKVDVKSAKRKRLQ